MSRPTTAVALGRPERGQSFLTFGGGGLLRPIRPGLLPGMKAHCEIYAST